ncbi:NHL repeat-containing protein [Gaopeijia maritima]|uniref:6-bladed beta-propeller n=1 Tax=Gaopeijia maritima TaxID=3119007 RepID=A0ABU9EAJ4_9BACT
MAALLSAGCGGAEADRSGPWSGAAAAAWVGAIDTVDGVVRVSTSAGGARLELREVLRIGGDDAPDAPRFGQVPDLVSDGEGGVWVLDVGSTEVVHLDAEGAETVRFGGPGEGPDRFQSPRRLHRSGDTIWVEDLGSLRWSAWSSAGAHLGVVALPPTLAGGEASWTADGLVAEVTGRADDGTRLRWAGRWRAEGDAFVRVDSFAPPPVPEPYALQTTVTRQGREVGLAFPLPLAHQPRHMPHPDGRRWVITPGGGDYRFQLAEVGGEVVREIRRDLEPVPVPESVRQAAIERLPAELRETEADRVPSVYPPFDRIVVADDGAFWLVRSTGDGALSFDLFDPEGRFGGTVEGAPEHAGFWLHAADARGVWGVRRDAAGRAVILRLEWAEG